MPYQKRAIIRFRTVTKRQVSAGHKPVCQRLPGILTLHFNAMTLLQLRSLAPY